MGNLRHEVTASKLNSLMLEAARAHPRLIAVSDNPHASVDFNHDSHSAIVDASQTRCNGPRFANLLVWLDNEWAFANSMLDVANFWADRLGFAVIGRVMHHRM